MLRYADKAEILSLHPAKLSPNFQPDGRHSVEKAEDMVSTALRNGSHRFEWIHCSPHRADFPVEVLLTPIVIEECQMIIVTWRDISERKLAEESMQQASMVYQSSSEAMMVVDAENHILSINPAFTVVTGYTLDEVLGQSPSMLSSGRQNEAFYQVMSHEINTTGHWQGEIWDKRKNGEIYPKWLTVNTVYNENGSAHRRIALFTDISRTKESEDLIWQQANFDSLTGLPNRRMFYDRLGQEIKKAQRGNLVLAVLFLDLDHFKEVNDTLGHDVGDTLLKEAALRLGKCVRDTDTVAHLGGDEFVVILGELGDPSSIERISQDILLKLAEPYRLLEEEVYLTASIGITLYPADARNTEALLKNADQAMYAAKNQGRNRHHYFTASMQEAAQTKMRLTADLRGALDKKEFWVAYQPIIELATGSIHKAEALIRWQHPVRGLVGPAEFIPIAEETGMIIPIGDWVFTEAAEQVKKWRKSHHPDFQISVNKSPVQFHNINNCNIDWKDYLQQLSLPRQSITIEITEGLLLDADTHVVSQLQEYENAGIQVSLDDFGTGYSSLAYIKKFHIDYLKIDQSFVRNLRPDSDDMALCEAIIVMAHKLGIKVIAEGIETAEQRDLLIMMGCDYGQGYLFSKPVPAAEFENTIKHYVKKPLG